MSKKVYCADAIAYMPDGRLVLIERFTVPLGYALPGGRLETGEAPEQAVVRELEEETGMEFTPVSIFGTYDEPNRDPRGHFVTTVIAGRAKGTPKAEEGKTRVVLVKPSEVTGYLPQMVLDHGKILADFLGI